MGVGRKSATFSSRLIAVPDAAALAAQLARPNGWAGRAIATAMDMANRKAVAAYIDALGPQPGEHVGEHVLDLGCGTGRPMAMILARGARVTGVDHSPFMVDRAARRVPRYGASAAVVEAGFAQLPIANASIDAVFACNSLYFWHDETAIVAELCRVMRPGARFVAYVTAARAMKRWSFSKAEQHRLFDVEQLQQIARAFPRTSEVASITSWGIGGFISRPVSGR